MVGATERSGTICSEEKNVSYLTDSLTGIIGGDYDQDEMRQERLREKYEEQRK